MFRYSEALLTQVTFTCDDGVTMGTVELGHVLGVFLQNVHLHGATLCEACVTDVALVWLLAFYRNERGWLIWMTQSITWPPLK